MSNVVPMAKASANAKLIEVGHTGLKHWGGILEEEFLRELRGPNGVKIYREMSKNDPVVGAGLFAYKTLAKEVEWRMDSAKPGDAKADEIAEFVKGCLFDDMSMSWQDLLTEIFSCLEYGWSWFETVFKQRQGEDGPTRSRFNDNKIGWKKWAIRGQDTLHRWAIDENGGIDAMIQVAAPLFKYVEIPIEKSLLFRMQPERGNPEGVSILRTAYTSWYYKRRFLIVRGIGIERDLAGLPVITPPEGVDIWNENDANMVRNKANAEKVVRNVRRDEHEGIVKPFGWTLELLASSGGRQFNITEVIAQLNSEIAMSMMTDFLLVGHEKVGARSMREDARDTFSHAAASFLDNICETINRFAIPQLIKLNGYPTELCPKLAHGPVAEMALADLMLFIEKTTAAGLLFPDGELEKFLRKRAMLPPPPEGEFEDRRQEEKDFNTPPQLAGEVDEDGEPIKPGDKTASAKPTPKDT